MKNLRRGAAAAIAVAVLVSLSACGENGTDRSNSNFAPMSNVEYNPTSGISLDSTVIAVRNLYVLASEGVLPPRLRMTMVNPTTRDDALVGATVGLPATSGTLVGGTLGAVPVVHGTSVIVGSGTGPQILFRGSAIKAGTWVPVTLLFRNGRAVAGSVLVQSPTSEAASGTVVQRVTPGPLDSIAPTPTATASVTP